MLLFMTLLTPPSRRGSPALAWVPGQLPEAGGEGAGAHPTVVAVGEFAAQSTQMFEQGRGVLFSVYAPAHRALGATGQRCRRHGAALPKTPAAVDKSNGPPSPPPGLWNL